MKSRIFAPVIRFALSLDTIDIFGKHSKQSTVKIQYVALINIDMTVIITLYFISIHSPLAYHCKSN